MTRRKKLQIILSWAPEAKWEPEGLNCEVITSDYKTKS